MERQGGGSRPGGSEAVNSEGAEEFHPALRGSDMPLKNKRELSAIMYRNDREDAERAEKIGTQIFEMVDREIGTGELVYDMLAFLPEDYEPGGVPHTHPYSVPLHGMVAKGIPNNDLAKRVNGHFEGKDLGNMGLANAVKKMGEAGYIISTQRIKLAESDDTASGDAPKKVPYIRIKIRKGEV